MFDLKTGKEVGMPGAYNEMSERSHINYSGGSEQSRRLRALLKTAMEAEGFAVYEPEWWHYDYKDWKEYPILNSACFQSWVRSGKEPILQLEKMRGRHSERPSFFEHF